MKSIKGVLIDVKNGQARVAVIPDTLEGYYEAVDCDCIDIVARKIGGKYFEIVCDDEGLLKDNPKVSGIGVDGKPMLVGNLFVCGLKGGDLRSISDDDCTHVLNHLMLIGTVGDPHPYPALGELDY